MGLFRTGDKHHTWLVVLSRGWGRRIAPFHVVFQPTTKSPLAALIHVFYLITRRGRDFSNGHPKTGFGARLKKIATRLLKVKATTRNWGFYGSYCEHVFFRVHLKRGKT